MNSTVKHKLPASIFLVNFPFLIPKFTKILIGSRFRTGIDQLGIQAVNSGVESWMNTLINYN